MTDNEDLRKAVIEKNLHSVFRLTEADEELRKAVLEKNIPSIFRLCNADEELRKAVIEENLYSISDYFQKLLMNLKLLQMIDMHYGEC